MSDKINDLFTFQCYYINPDLRSRDFLSIYVVIQKCKQKSNFIRQLYNSQIVVELILKFSIFVKNVNKQLKSADFFSEMSKFQKKSLKRILSFFIVMSKHTLLFVAHLPNVKYLIFPIYIFYYLLLYSNEKTSDGKFN